MPDPQLHAAIDAVRRAGKLCKHLQGDLASGEVIKGDGSPVTVADFAAQVVVIRTLIEHGVDAAIAGEEQADALQRDAALCRRVTEALRSTGAWAGATEREVVQTLGHRAWTSDALPDRAWVIDPIDGTKGFIAQRQFAVCLALIERGVVTVAALGCPNLALDPSAEPGELDPSAIDAHGTVIACRRGDGIVHGALDSDLLSPVAPRAIESRRSPILTFSVEPSEGRVRDFDALADEMQRRFGRRPVPLSMDSQAKYALVARGQADIYDRPPRRNFEKSWDHAAGCLLIEEAGCVVTDAMGEPLEWSCVTLGKTRGILGAPADLHAQVLAARGAIGLA